MAPLDFLIKRIKNTWLSKSDRKESFFCFVDMSCLCSVLVLFWTYPNWRWYFLLFFELPWSLSLSLAGDFGKSDCLQTSSSWFKSKEKKNCHMSKLTWTYWKYRATSSLRFIYKNNAEKKMIWTGTHCFPCHSIFYLRSSILNVF